MVSLRAGTGRLLGCVVSDASSRHILPSANDPLRSDIMAYFVGPPGDPRAGHDDKARLIAERAREFSQTRFRWEDMQSYVLLLSLEVRREEAAACETTLSADSLDRQYVRMISDDREAASYDG